VRRGFCITLTHFSLQLFKTETGFYPRIVQVIFVVITAKIIQGFIVVLPIIFDIISSIFLTHLHPAVINTSSWCGLESFKEKTFSVNG